MYQIDNSSAIAVQPASTPAGPAGFFTDGNPAGGQQATIVPAEWLNSIQQELINAIKAAGIVPNKAAFNQLALAIQSGQGGYGTDTGVANAYVVALATAPAPLENGQEISFQVKTTNTGPSTLNLNGEGVLPIVGLGLHPLQGNELIAGAVADLQYVVAPAINGGNGGWVLIACSGGAQQLGDGSYVATPPIFDTSAKLATAAFVQRALGNWAGINNYAAAQTLTNADSGHVVLANGNIILPTLASLPSGARIKIVATAGARTVTTQGADQIALPNGTNVASISVLAQGWIVLERNAAGTMWNANEGDAVSGLSPYFGVSFATNGYQKLPSGIVLQWGSTSPTGSDGTLVTNFPIAFPNACLQVLTTGAMNAASNAMICGSTSGAPTKTQFTFVAKAANGSNVPFTGAGGFFFAIGY